MSSYWFFPDQEPGGGDFVPAYSLGWTLQYEKFFYQLFASVLECRRETGVAILSVGLFCLASLGAVFPLPWPIDRLASTQILEFVFGMLIAEAWLQRLSLPVWCCGAFGLLGSTLLVATSSSISQWWYYRGLIWGIPAAFIVAGAVFCPPLPANFLRRWLESLGNMSYSLYLTHYFVFVIAARALQPLLDHPGSVQPLAYGALLLSAALFFASATYRLFERPVTRRLHAWAAPQAPSLS